MATDSTVLLAVLKALAPRTANSGYARPEVEGVTRSQIDAAVDELRRGGYIEAAHIPSTFGDNPAHWAPGALTVQGRHLLEELTKTARRG